MLFWGKSGEVEKRDAPPYRLLSSAFLTLHDPSTAYGFTQIDVTEVERRIRKATRRLRRGISLTGYVTYCWVQTINEHRCVNAALVGGKVLSFKDVDLATTIDRRVNGERMVAIGRIRAAQNLSLAEMLTALRSQRVFENQDQRSLRFRSLLQKRPRLAAWLLRRLGKDPAWLVEIYGTTMVTVLQAPGISRPLHVLAQNLCGAGLFLGPVTDEVKAGPDGRIEVRRVLHVTFAVKHDLLDGMEMLAGSRTFFEKTESAEALNEAFIEEFAGLNNIALPGETVERPLEWPLEREVA